MTNRARVLALIKSESGLTDSEVRLRTGIEPHQQVNQICRSLAVAGLIVRVDGPDGRIVNLPAQERAERSPPSAIPSEAVPPTVVERQSAVGAEPAGPPSILSFTECLFVVPCSGSKRRGTMMRGRPTLLEALPGGLASELSDRRRHNAAAVGVDESTLLPASERYEGTFYKAGRSALSGLADRGAHVLIISGGYGLVLAAESIGMYDQMFRPAMWPNRLIERCLAGFAEINGVRRVIGVLSATTGYATVVRRTRWPRQVEEAILASPEAAAGALVKAPRAQGEWLVAVAEAGGIPKNWRSSDGLRMEITYP